MPLRWSAYAIARTAGFVGVTAFAGSAITTSVTSRLLVTDDALADVDETRIDLSPPPRPSSSKDADRKQAEREALLGAALAGQAKSETAERLDRIVDNNIFCPDCKPTPAAGPEAEAEAKPAMAATALPLALLATMESSDPLLSMATILDTERSSTGVFAVNDEIRPGVVIAGISRGRVVLRNGTGIETLGFPEPEQPKQKKRKAKSKRKRKRKRGSREIPGARDAIECKGNACTVDRKFVEKLMANPRLLARQAKVIPAVRDGETRGFRIHRVRRGTLPRLLGLKNGDTLLSVNGTELDSMDRAIGLYTKLRRASELSLTVERKGKVFEKQISIR